MKTKRPNVEISDDTDYWLSIDAANHAQSVRARCSEVLAERAAAVAAANGKKAEERLPTG